MMLFPKQGDENSIRTMQIEAKRRITKPFRKDTTNVQDTFRLPRQELGINSLGGCWLGKSVQYVVVKWGDYY